MSMKRIEAALSIFFKAGDTKEQVSAWYLQDDEHVYAKLWLSPR